MARVTPAYGYLPGCECLAENITDLLGVQLHFYCCLCVKFFRKWNW